MFDFAGKRRPRADQRHLAAQHVEEVGQLVDAGAAQERTQRMQTRIVANLEYGTVELVQMEQVVAHVVRAFDHRAQLEHAKAASVESDALLTEERRSPIDD